MKILFLIVSLLFYISGILSIISDNGASGATFMALGCTFFIIAISRRNKK